MSEKHHITRAAGSLGSATLISRIAGLIRDMVIASQFGAGLLTDAFFMAFTIPNLLPILLTLMLCLIFQTILNFCNWLS